MGSAERDLLFYETFNHEGSQELHVDLVRFLLPVVVREVRIVSPETKACSELNKMGQTSPSSFTLDIFCNDSTNPLAPTFDPLGALEYNDESVGLVVKAKNSSDLVVVKGFYSVLTLCIYGNVAMPPSRQGQFQIASPHSPHSANHSYSDNSGDSDSGSSYSDMEVRGGGRRGFSKGGGGSPERGGEGKGDGDGGGGKRDAYVDDLFEPFSPVNSPDHLFDLSDEERKRSSTAAMGYPVEELSDDEITFEGGDEFDMQEVGFESYMDSVDWMTSGVSFNPYQCDLSPLESFPSQTETPHEALLAKLQKTETTSKRSVADEASKLRDIVLKTKEMANTIKWVETMEEIPSFLYPGLAQLQKRSGSEGKEVMQKLASWTVQCLNLEVAKQSPVAANIRQLKAGLRMVPSLAALGRRCTHMLVKHNVLEELCYITLADPMVSTIKLQALRAIDSLLDYPQGLERFLGWNKRSSSSSSALGPQPTSAYQQILNLVLSQPAVRVSSAASVLLAKAHVYELLANLQDAVGKVVACTPVKTLPEDFWSVGGRGREGEGGEGEGERKGGEEGDAGDSSKGGKKRSNSDRLPPTGEEQEAMEEGARPDTDSATPTPVPVDVISRIASCLEELKKCVEEAHHTMVQSPLKAFPTQVKCFPETERDHFPPLMRMFQCRRLLECVLVLVTAPATALDEGIFSGVRDLVLLLLASQEGVLFLSSNTAVINHITRALTQASENQLALMQTFTELLSGGTADSCSPQNLGLLLIYHLQVLQSLDQLRRAPKSSMTELEATECVSALHTLYTMTLAPIGKSALTYVLSQRDNITALFPFVESRGQKEHDTKLTRSSVSSRYAAVILLQLLQSQVRGEFVVTYGGKLLAVAEFFKDNSSPTMSDLYNWFYPVRNITSDSTTAIPTLVATIKDLVPQISSTKPNKIIAPILTSLRLLLTFILPPQQNKGGQKELKWHHNTIVLFSTGALDTLQTLLQKLFDLLLPLWSQRQIIPVALGNNVTMVATFALRVMRAMLGQLMDGEESFRYRDMRIVGALVPLHAVICSVPYSSVISNAAPEIQSSILDILVMFTKPEIPEPEVGGGGGGGGDEKPGVDSSTSCWCLMLQELLNQTLTSPHCFLSGLMLVSELLPLPLPVHMAQPCSDSDAANICRLHALWALHFEPFVGTVSEIVVALLRSSCPELLGVLRRVCAQLADLSPSLAILVARYVVRMILSEIEKQLESPEEDSHREGEGEGQGEGGAEGEVGGEGEERMEESKIVYSCLLRMLTTCAVLSQQVAFKIAVLDLLRQKETEDTRSFSRFIPLLLFLMQKKETNIPTKLCIMTILNSLCSVYITFVAAGDEMEGAGPLSEQQQADCLPGQSQLEHITSAVIGHVTSPDNPLTTVMQGLKVIVSVAQYNAGLVQLFSLLRSSVSGFSQLLVRLTDSLKKTDSQSSITFECLSLLLTLYRYLLSTSLIGKVEVKGRRGGHSHSSELASLKFPRSLLGAVLRGDGGRDLLTEVKETVQESYKEDGSLLEELLAPISDLEDALQGMHVDSIADLPTLEQEAWPEMQPLKSQFEQRSTIMVTSDMGRSPEFWLATPPHDESEFKPDTTIVDLPKLASDTMPSLNLEEELKKRLLPSPPPSPREKRKRKLVLSGPEAQKKLREAIRLRQASGRGKDMFRTRKQNTSRPPSMHVDDFMAMGPRSQVHRGQLPPRNTRSNTMGGLPYFPTHHGHHGHQPHHPHSHTHHPGGSFMHQLGSRWQMGSIAPGNLGHYPRRELAGIGLRDWERFPPFMASAAHMKPPPLRSAPLWPPQLADPYRGRSRMLPWPEGSSRSLSSEAASSSSRMPDLAWKTRLYKRLL